MPFPVVTAAAYTAVKSDNVPVKAGSPVKVISPSVKEFAKTRSAALIAASSKVTARALPDSTSCALSVVAMKSAMLTPPLEAT